MTDNLTAALAGAGVGGGFAFVSGFALDWIREGWKRRGDRRDFASALAAEVNGWLSWRKRAESEGAGQGDSAFKQGLSSIGLVGNEPLFSVFDGAGPRLGLLPRELADEIVGCYMEMKSVVDGLRGAVQALQTGGHPHMINAAGQRAHAVMAEAEQVAVRAEGLVRLLRQCADRRHRGGRARR